MTIVQLVGSLPSPAGPRSRGGRSGRVTTTVLALAGTAALVAGVRMPWISTFDGLITQSGWATRNGSLLTAGAALIAVLALAHLVRPSSLTRWLVASAGLGCAAFAGYLVIQLYASLGGLDTMTFASAGPGLFACTGGGMVAFATIFLPMPVPETAATVARTHATRPLLQARGSVLRFPVAALAVTAGLAHVPVTPAHLAEASYVGVLFILLTVGLVLGATILLVADSAAAYGYLAVACLAAVLAFAVSRTVGLPLLTDDIGNWREPLGILSVATESAVVVLSLRALRRPGA